MQNVLHFATSAIKVRNVFGSGMGTLWSICDEDGTILVHRGDLPTEVTFLEGTSAPSRGASRQVAVAYDPEKVRVLAF